MIFNAHIETNKITARDELGAVDQRKVPAGAIYFEGIVSNGDKNRNGYIIDSEAWFFDKSKYVKDFLKTGSILWGHDDNKPIGRPLTFEKQDNGDIQVTGYVFDDIHTNWAIGRGIVLGLSTGHIPHEWVWEGTEGDRLTDAEFWKLPWEEIFSGNYTMVVTKAEICEFSFVTVRSNRKSTIANSAMVNAYADTFKKDPTEVELLFSNQIQTMNKVVPIKNEGEETPAEAPVPATTPGVEVPETPASEETPASPETPTVPVEENKLGVDTDPTILLNKIEELQTTHAQEIETLKTTLEAKHKADLDTAINKIRTEEKEKLLAKAPGANGAKVSTVNSLADFKSKHLKK